MQKISLNGQWICIPDLENRGIEKGWFIQNNLKKKDTGLLTLDIPKSFNLLEGYEFFEGVFWHYREFEFNPDIDHSNYEYQIMFKGANYNAKVWLNEKFLGEHDGGFTPFRFLINKTLKKGNNFIVVRVDNIRRKNGIPSLYFDWFNWGGIYRDVDLIVLNKNRITDIKIKTEVLSKQKSKIFISFKSRGAFNFKWQILDIDKKSIVFEGIKSTNSSLGKISLILDNPKLWSPSTPNLYYFQIIDISPEVKTNLLFKCHFGIRQIEVHSSYLYLNKKRLMLKGVSLHEEYLPYGRTIPYEKRLEDLRRIKAIGFNAIRTAHYSHDESLIDIADKVGLLILEEIPVYWDCNYKSNDTFKLAAKMLRTLIKRDINHPSVIWWSVGNEIPIHKRECANFIKRLMNFAKMHDSSRLVTYVSRKLTSDLTRKKADIATINTYFGWYFGDMKMLSLILDWMRTPIIFKPWIFTEFGAGAKFGFRDNWKNQTKFSEEYQLNLLDYTIRTINSKDYFSGWFIWIFRDFKSIHRNNEYQQGFNRKGIVSEKSIEKKLICYHLPKILNRKRKTINTKVLGIILWVISFPFSYLITTHLITLLLDILVKNDYKRGIRRLSIF